MDYTKYNNFSSVYVIEFLKDGNLKTGRDLYESCILPLGQIKENLYTNLTQPESKREFFDVLSKIVDDCTANSRGPILHIEAHGNDDGIANDNIVESADQIITWSELKPFLCHLNEISGLNLLVIMAACDGFNLTKVVQLTDRAPVWGIIGPQVNVEAGHILDGFKEFYKELFKSYDGRKALNSLNNSPDVKDWYFKFLNAEFFFMYVYKNYLETLCTENALLKRAQKIVKEGGAGRPLNSNVESQMIKDFYKLLISTQEAYFERHKRHFFMMDIFEGYDQRFQITFDQCKKFMQGNGS